MNDDIDRLIFRQELTRLSSDYERCNDVRVKEEILKDMEILKRAIELIS